MAEAIRILLQVVTFLSNMTLHELCFRSPTQMWIWSAVLCAKHSSELSTLPCRQAHLTWAPTVHTPLQCLPLQIGSMKRAVTVVGQEPLTLLVLVLTGLRNSKLASQGNS